jgi:hypothetical protein
VKTNSTSFAAIENAARIVEGSVNDSLPTGSGVERVQSILAGDAGGVHRPILAGCNHDEPRQRLSKRR